MPRSPAFRNASCGLHGHFCPAIVLSLLACALPAHAENLPPPIHAVEVSSPRNYAIVIGEILNGEVRVVVESGYELETAALPTPGSAVDDYLELRSLRWTRQTAGGETVYRIALAYQVFKGVRDAETLTVPALPLRFHRHAEAVETQAPTWHFTLSPVIPANTPDEAVALRGDLPPPVDSGAGHSRWLSVYLAGLLGLGVFAAWRLALLPFRRTSPFARAVRLLRKLGKQPQTLDTYRQGAKLVHAALNETTGQVVFSGQLQRLLLEQPGYAEYREELAQFFALSDRLFFTDGTEYPADYPFLAFANLCHKLAAVEVG